MALSFYNINGNSSYNNYSLYNSSIFGSNSTGNLLGDFSLIRSGAYKKLMSAYYKNESSSTAKSLLKGSDEKLSLTEAKDDAEALNKAASKLMTTDTSKDKREELTKNMEDFVSSYNEVIDSGSAVDTQSVLRNALWMTQRTSKNSSLLQEVGVTVGSDNKLSLDKDKLADAESSTLNTLLSGKNSFAGLTAQKASSIANIAQAAASMGTSASAYTYNGGYAYTPVSSMINTLL